MFRHFVLALLILLVAACERALVKDAIKAMPYERGLVLPANYQAVARCLKDHQPTITMLSGPKLELVIYDELGVAEYSLGGSSFYWVLIELRKSDDMTTVADVYAKQTWREEANYFLDVTKECAQ